MSPATPLREADEAIERLVKTSENISASTKVLDRLEALVHVSRAAKAPDVKVTDVKVRTLRTSNEVGAVSHVTAKTGDTAQYGTRITFTPKAGFNCTCPDLEKRRLPCKHVAALAVVSRKKFWALSDQLQTDITELQRQRGALEELYRTLPDLTRNLATKAKESLTGSLSSLSSGTD
jgi:hypothetical protein